ncbi:hypothetical protein Droror1_Dr00007446 [Drosera rotundifolia]
MFLVSSMWEIGLFTLPTSDLTVSHEIREIERPQLEGLFLSVILPVRDEVHEYRDPKAGWLFKFSATLVAGVAVVAYVWRRTWTRINPSQDVGTSQDTDDDPELICFCGLRARLRVCRTAKNPYRLFYNCPKQVFRNQCDFFRWCDEMSITLDRCQEEKTFLRDECIRLRERINYLRSRREHNRVVSETEKSDLTSKLSAVQAELDDIKSRIQQVIESDAMPPFNDSCMVDDEPDGAVVIGTV